MIMKNLHISMAFIFVLLLITASCSDKDDSAPRVIPTKIGRASCRERV